MAWLTGERGAPRDKIDYAKVTMRGARALQVATVTGFLLIALISSQTTYALAQHTAHLSADRVLLTAGKRERGSLYWEKRGAGMVIYSVPTKQRHVAITFDDGPHATYTPQILAVLDEFHAKATFFVIGDMMSKKSELLKDIYRRGHEIGNHTQTHPQVSKMTTREVEACDSAITFVTGVKPTLLRPPGGRISEQTLQVARHTQHKLILWTWDVDTRDWAQPGVFKIVQLVVSHIDPGDIVLFHDGGGKRSQTVAALRIILNQLTKDGYHFVTVSQLLHERVPIPPGKE